MNCLFNVQFSNVLSVLYPQTDLRKVGFTWTLAINTLITHPVCVGDQWNVSRVGARGSIRGVRGGVGANGQIRRAIEGWMSADTLPMHCCYCRPVVYLASVPSRITRIDDSLLIAFTIS